MSEQLQFRDAEIDGVVFRALKKEEDARGWLCELFRVDELEVENHPQMAYMSETRPGVVRGPHEHVEQTDYLAFVGPADFRLYLWDIRPRSPSFMARQVLVVGTSNRQSVIIPPGVVHAYKNIGTTEGWVFNAPNRLFGGTGRRQPVDEIRHENDPNTPYVVD